MDFKTYAIECDDREEVKEVIEHAVSLGYALDIKEKRSSFHYGVYLNGKGTASTYELKYRKKHKRGVLINIDDFLELTRVEVTTKPKERPEMPKEVMEEHKALVGAIVKGFLKANPNVAITGGIALDLQDFQDSAVDCGIDFIIEEGAEFYLPSTWSAHEVSLSHVYTGIIKAYSYKDITIWMWKKTEDTVITEKDGIKMATISSIMKWKEDYCNDEDVRMPASTIKHQKDLIKFYKEY